MLLYQEHKSGEYKLVTDRDGDIVRFTDLTEAVNAGRTLIRFGVARSWQTALVTLDSTDFLDHQYNPLQLVLPEMTQWEAVQAQQAAAAIENRLQAREARVVRDVVNLKAAGE